MSKLCITRLKTEQKQDCVLIYSTLVGVEKSAHAVEFFEEVRKSIVGGEDKLRRIVFEEYTAKTTCRTCI